MHQSKTLCMCRYFGGTQIITVPGFTYEVQDYYLDDVLAMVGNPHGKPNGAASTTPAAAGRAVRVASVHGRALCPACLSLSVFQSQRLPAVRSCLLLGAPKHRALVNRTLCHASAGTKQHRC